MLQVSDEGAIAAIVDEVLNDPTCAKAVDDLRNGDEKSMHPLVGQTVNARRAKPIQVFSTKVNTEDYNGETNQSNYY